MNSVRLLNALNALNALNTLSILINLDTFGITESTVKYWRITDIVSMIIIVSSFGLNMEFGSLQLAMLNAEL